MRDQLGHQAQIELQQHPRHGPTAILLSEGIDIDLRVLCVSLSISVAAGLAFGLLPATVGEHFRATRLQFTAAGAD